MNLINDLDVSDWCILMNYFGAVGLFWGGGLGRNYHFLDENWLV